MFSTIGYEKTCPDIVQDFNLIQMKKEQTTFSNLVCLTTNPELIISVNTQKAHASSDQLSLCVQINTNINLEQLKPVERRKLKLTDTEKLGKRCPCHRYVHTVGRIQLFWSPDGMKSWKLSSMNTLPSKHLTRFIFPHGSLQETQTLWRRSTRFDCILSPLCRIKKNSWKLRNK